MKAVATIKQWVKASIFHHITDKMKADELWRKLEAMYEKNAFINTTMTIR